WRSEPVGGGGRRTPVGEYRGCLSRPCGGRARNPRTASQWTQLLATCGAGAGDCSVWITLILQFGTDRQPGLGDFRRRRRRPQRGYARRCWRQELYDKRGLRALDRWYPRVQSRNRPLFARSRQERRSADPARIQKRNQPVPRYSVRVYSEQLTRREELFRSRRR